MCQTLSIPLKINQKNKRDFVENYNCREPTPSPKKSPGPQVHAHFFPQHNQERIDPNDFADGQSEDNDQPRRMYVREQFTHENTVRGNVAESNDPIIRR